MTEGNVGFDPRRPFKTRDGREVADFRPLGSVGYLGKVDGLSRSWWLSGKSARNFDPLPLDLVNTDAPAPDNLDVEARAIFQILWRECPERFMRYEDDQPMWLEVAARARAVWSAEFAALRKANVERNCEWSAGQMLSLSFRGNELAGEVGGPATS